MLFPRSRRSLPPYAPSGARTRGNLASSIALGLCLGLGACRRADHPQPAAAAPTPASAETEVDAAMAGETNGPADVLDQQTAEAETTRILAAVAKARELAPRSEVAVDVIDKPGIRKFAQESMYEHTTKEELQMLGRIEIALGILPAGSDPEQVILDLLEQGVLGLYDPKRKTLFIGDFVEKAMLTMVVGHEIAHGLQDMYFDLEALQKPIRHRTDAESARRFLVEGEAQAAFLTWRSGDQGVAAFKEPVLDAMGDQVLELAGTVSPYPILARGLQMPYADGTATVLRLVQREGWAAVSELYKQLPESTEQMLHLDKLLAREPPIPTKMDAGALEPLLAPVGRKLLWHDELGEATLLAMLADVGGAKSARAAAAGWGGDHFVAFERPDQTGMVLAGVLTWDTPGDAKEFAKLFAQYLSGHGPQPHVLDTRGATVVYALGVPEGISDRAMIKALWKGAQVGK